MNTMMIDDIERTGSVTRVRVLAEVGDEDRVGAFVLSSLWGGDGDYDEVIHLGEGVFEVICS